jgi:signal transduction histidine kinase
LTGLIKKSLEIGIYATGNEFDAQRVRSLNAGVMMITAVALISLPVSLLSGSGQTMPGTLLVLALISLVIWLQARGRAYEAALSITGICLMAVSAQSFYLGQDFGVHFWLLALVLFPFLFFPRRSKHTPTILGVLITVSFAAFAVREQNSLGINDGSLLTQILSAAVVLGLSITMRRLLLRAEQAHHGYKQRVERQADQLRERQGQLEVALADAYDARRVLDLRVAERTLDLQTAHDRLSLELRERNRIEDERKLLESELQHAQRLESVGQLAGGVAHDFNNLLTVIGGNVELVLDEPGSITATQLAFLSEVQAATERAASVTGQLLAYSRKQAVVLETIEAHVVVEGVRGMIERAAGEQIIVEIESPDSIGNVRAGHGQIEQVLMNLALNACDAMPSGGTLRIEMTALETLPSSITQSSASQKPHVVLRVSDTGDGMDEATRCRVFEPFFTTKGPGKGTGLGLSVVDSIVTQHHGFLDLQSTLGQGSCFSIYLPIVEAAPSATQDVGGAAVTQSGRGETVLVIEDDPAVRRVTSGLLRNKGYNVLVADGGAQALEIAQNHSGGFDLFLTDVVMPGLQGPELISSLLELYPDTAVLFVSGYTDPERFVDLNLNDRRTFLQKPFSSEALERELRTLLKPPSPPSAR